MKEYTTPFIRNVALASHLSSGKTMLVEACLHVAGGTTRLGKIDDGTTVSDYDEEELRRKISLYTSVVPVEYKDVKINFLDTPGYTDFVGEVISAMRVADGVIVLVDSVAGLEVGTEIALRYIDTFKLPAFLVINKMERENANFQKALASVQDFSEIRLLPVQLPLGEKSEFKGVIDLLTMKAFKGDGKTVIEIPAEYKEAASKGRTALMEAAAESDDALMEKYFENGELSSEETLRGLRTTIRNRQFFPVFAASGGAEIGIIPILDAIVSLFPSPADAPKAIAQNKDVRVELTCTDSGPLAAYVWKTTADPFVGKQTFFRLYSGMLNSDSRVWNQTKNYEERIGQLSLPRGKEGIPTKTVHAGDLCMVPKLAETSTSNTICDRAHPLTLPVPVYPTALYRVAITPRTMGDSTKISPTLTRLCEEDMTLSWHQEAATLQTILQGMGDQHIDVAIRRAESRFQVGLAVEEPKVPYQETITKKAEGMHRHKKQTGGSGQFGEVWLRVEPDSEKGFEYEWAVVGGAIGQNYSASIQKGLQALLKEGILAGFPISGVKVSVFDGKEHPVDSKPIAFEIAGREAFKNAFMDAGPVLYEPIMNVKVIVPEANMGDVLGDMNTRRARVQGMETDKGHSTISATVPLSEMLRYTTQLRSITGGRGYFSMELDHYEVVPSFVQQQIIDARKKEIEAKKE
jgi:elongation factor G